MKNLPLKKLTKNINIDTNSRDSTKLFVLLVFSMTAVVSLFTSGINKFLISNFNFGLLNIIIGFLIIISVVCFYLSKSMNFLTCSILLLVASNIIILVATGGIENTGIIWSFLFPLLSLFLTGPFIGIILNLVITCLFICIFFIPQMPFSVPYSSSVKLHFIISYSSVTLLAFIMEYTKDKYMKERNRFFKKLSEAQNKLDSLHKIIPVCSNCKKIKNSIGAWEDMEDYIKDHTEIEFSHGLCPECIKKLYENEPWFQKWKNETSK